MDSMGSRIAKRRVELGMKPAELARQVGIKQPSLWLIENDRTKNLKAPTLHALCQALLVTPDYILTGPSTSEDPGLAVMESELVQTLRALKPEDRIALLQYARFLRGDKANTKKKIAQGDGSAVVRALPKKSGGKR